jgi:DNA adenine methylase
VAKPPRRNQSVDHREINPSSETSGTLSLPGFASAGQTRPFLRWAGGKTRLLSAILPFVPYSVANYHEPFLGGGALFFAIRERICGRVHLSDLNLELINTWCAVRDDPTALLAALEVYRGCDAEEQYYAVRDGDQPDNPIERAARFLYLNQTAWNGLWRVNRWGRYNVPWGARPFRGFTRDELCRISAVLQGVSIEQADFRHSLARARPGDFVYMDPPYLPISDTSKFSGYTKRRFRAADLAELAEHCHRLTEQGVRWVVSNRDNAMVRELFKHAQIVRLTTRRSVAAQNRRDVQPADSPEAIIIGGPKT